MTPPRKKIAPKARDRRTRPRKTTTTARVEGPRRQEILDAGALLMQQRGFVGTTIEDVAAHLELTKAAFYYYLENKEELLFQILSQTLDVTVAKLSEIERSDASPREKLDQIVASLVRLMADRPEFFTVYFQEKGHLDVDHLRSITKTERSLVGSVERTYRKGALAKAFRDIDPTAAAYGILGMCVWVHKWYRPGGRLSVESVTRTFQDMAANGYLAAPGKRGSHGRASVSTN